MRSRGAGWEEDSVDWDEDGWIKGWKDVISRIAENDNEVENIIKLVTKPFDEWLTQFNIFI